VNRFTNGRTKTEEKTDKTQNSVFVDNDIYCLNYAFFDVKVNK